MKQISLTQGQFTIVDNKNYKWLSQWKWYAHWNKHTKSYYVLRGNKSENGKQYTIFMAREILDLRKGDKKQADHINHNTLDNCKSNLRIVTNQQNHFNRKKSKGYIWHKRYKKYMAYIKLGGKQIHLGCFITAKEACAAYLKAKKKYHKI